MQYYRCRIRQKRIMCEAILETIYTGFKSIEESYTRHIDIVEEEV